MFIAAVPLLLESGTAFFYFWNCIYLFFSIFFVKSETFLIMFYRSFLIFIYADTTTLH